MRELERAGVGLTVIVNVLVEPAHPTALYVNVGVTMIVATTGIVPALIAVNAPIAPDPLAASPMPGAELVQA